MAELPVHRLSDSPPFTCCRVYMFRPFLIRQHRNEIKRYGAILRAWEAGQCIQKLLTVLTHSFIQALRRVIARRENIKTLFSDNGSNFIGCENELKKAYEEMENQKIQSFMQGQGGDQIKWVRNLPADSSLDEESLFTLVT